MKLNFGYSTLILFLLTFLKFAEAETPITVPSKARALVFCFGETPIGKKDTLCEYRLGEIKDTTYLETLNIKETELNEKKLEAAFCSHIEKFKDKPILILFSGRGMRSSGSWVFDWKDRYGISRGDTPLTPYFLTDIANRCLRKTGIQASSIMTDGCFLDGEEWDMAKNWTSIHSYKDAAFNSSGTLCYKDTSADHNLIFFSKTAIKAWKEKRGITDAPDTRFDLSREPSYASAPVSRECREFWREIRDIDFRSIVVRDSSIKHPRAVSCNQIPKFLEPIHESYAKNCTVKQRLSGHSAEKQQNTCAKALLEYRVSLTYWETLGKEMKEFTEVKPLAEKLIWFEYVLPYELRKFKSNEALQVADRIIELNPSSQSAAVFRLNAYMALASEAKEKNVLDSPEKTENWKRAATEARRALSHATNKTESEIIKSMLLYAETQGGRPDLLQKAARKLAMDLNEAKKAGYTSSFFPPLRAWMLGLLY